MASTSGTQDKVPNMDEESKRNYIRNFLRTNLKKIYTQSQDPTNANNTQPMSDAEFESIFGEDVDDSDEIFDNILLKAREEFEIQKEFKKKFPFFKNIDDIFEAPKPRKRKSKVIEDTINVMNKFKKSLLETKEPEKTISTNDTSTKINKTETEICTNVPLKNRSTIKIYPKWKTTETYTPVFDLPVNPNWVNKKCSPKSNKMYTPKQIHNWLDNGADTDFTVPFSCKSIRSNTATCHSMIDNKSISSTITSPLYSSTPLHSTIFRFRPSPPEHIPCNISDGSSNISVTSIFGEEIEQLHQIKNDFPAYEFQPEINENIDQDSDEDQYSFYPEKYNKFPENHYNEYKKYEECKEKHYYVNKNKISNEMNENISSDPTKASFFEDFIRNLNHNIRSNYNMEVKCSMKLKYFK